MNLCVKVYANVCVRVYSCHLCSKMDRWYRISCRKYYRLLDFIFRAASVFFFVLQLISRFLSALKLSSLKPSLGIKFFLTKTQNKCTKIDHIPFLCLFFFASSFPLHHEAMSLSLFCLDSLLVFFFNTSGRAEAFYCDCVWAVIFKSIFDRVWGRDIQFSSVSNSIYRYLGNLDLYKCYII